MCLIGYFHRSIDKVTQSAMLKVNVKITDNSNKTKEFFPRHSGLKHMRKAEAMIICSEPKRALQKMSQSNLETTP